MKQYSALYVSCNQHRHNSRVPLVEEGCAETDLAVLVRRRVVCPCVHGPVTRITLSYAKQIRSYAEPAPVVQLQLELQLRVAGHFPSRPLVVLDELRLCLLCVEVTGNGEGGIDRVQAGVDDSLMSARTQQHAAHLQVVARDTSAADTDTLETERPARVRLNPFAEVSSHSSRLSSQAAFRLVLVDAAPVQPADGAKPVRTLCVDAEREPSTRRRVEETPFLVCLRVS